MNAIERILSRPVAKPYRSKGINSDEQPYLNDNGHVDFSPGDIENPKNWTTTRRWYITTACVLMVVNATMASSSPSGCLGSISKELHVGQEAAGLVITVFLLGYCAGPLLFAPLSEFYGRRWVFYITFSLYAIFNFLCAFTPNFAGLLIGRFLSGTFASAPLSNAPGVLADIWGPVERGNAMAMFSMMTFIGPSIGPVIGGFIELKLNWRWDFYMLLWFAGITWVIMLTIPETLPARVLTNKARRIRAANIPGYENVRSPSEADDTKLMALFKVALSRPWQILLDPIAFFVAIYISIVYALLYMLFTIYPIVFQQKRGWNSGVGELPLLGTVVGAIFGGMIVFWQSHRDRERAEAGYKAKAEDRLPLAMVGGVMFAVTMFWFAWTAEFNSIHWIVPTIAGAFLSTSILLIFVAYLNYLTDTYLMFTASAMAANTITRSAMGAAAPLYTEYMFKALGVGGGGSLIGGVAVLLVPIPFIFYKYGESLRRRSKFAPTPDKKDESAEEKRRDEEEGAGGEVDTRRSSTSTGSSTDIESGHVLGHEPKHQDHPETQEERTAGDQDLDRELHANDKIIA
jgi:DHA1 family multidrug resistance protein-like MFS transporter